MPEERDGQGWRDQGHGHPGGERCQPWEQPGEPVAAIRQNVRLHGKAPPTRASEPQPRIQIAPFDHYRRRFGVRPGSGGERALKIAVQARPEVRRLVLEALGKMPLQERPKVQRLEPANQEEMAFPDRRLPLLEKG